MRFEELTEQQQQNIIDYITETYPNEKDRSAMLAYIKLRMELVTMKEIYAKLPWYKKCFRNASGMSYVILEYFFPKQYALS